MVNTYALRNAIIRENAELARQERQRQQENQRRTQWLKTHPYGEVPPPAYPRTVTWPGATGLMQLWGLPSGVATSIANRVAPRPAHFMGVEGNFRNSYKKGGKIPKAGLYKLHKGEVVVPAHRVKTVDKALRKSKRKPLKKVCKNCVLTKKQLTARRVSSTRARR